LLRNKQIVSELFHDPILAKFLYKASVNDRDLFQSLLGQIELQLLKEDLTHKKFSDKLTEMILFPIEQLFEPSQLEAANQHFVTDIKKALLESLKEKQYVRAQRIIAFVDSIYEFAMALRNGATSARLTELGEEGLARCREIPGNTPVTRASWNMLAFIAGASTFGALSYFTPFAIAGEELTLSMSRIITALLSAPTAGYTARRLCNDWLEKNKRGDTKLTQSVNSFFKEKTTEKAKQEGYKKYKESIVTTGIIEAEKALFSNKR